MRGDVRLRDGGLHAAPVAGRNGAVVVLVALIRIASLALPSAAHYATAGRAAQAALKALEHPPAKFTRHEAVDDRIEAGVQEWQQVEDDAQCVGPVVEI